MNTAATPSRFFDFCELRRLLVIFAPLYVANLVHTGMGLIDTLVAGRAGEADLAGVAMGTAICWPVFISLGHVLAIIAPMISRLRGEGKESQIGHLLNNAKVLAFFLMLVAALALLVFVYSDVIYAVAKDTISPAISNDYILYMATAIPAVMMMRVAQGHFEGFGQTRPAMIVALCGIALNYPLNLLFVFGWGPIPAMGGAGCGVATALINWMMALGFYIIMFGAKQHRSYAKQLAAWCMPDWSALRRILRLGFPMGIATLCEVSFFCAVTFVIAPLGTLAVSAQQVAINISGVLFMMPMSFGIAGSIRAAYYIGAKQAAQFRALLSTLFISALGGTLFFAGIVVLMRYDILALFTDSQAIIDLAQLLVILCALYQIPDTVQALMSGLLRGCHDTPIITWVNLGSYWLIGFPLTYVLVRTDIIVPAMGPAGAWVSFIVALTLTSILLSWRFMRTKRRLFV